jgi:hypothetical protein
MNQSALTKYTLLVAMVLNLSGRPALGGSLGIWTGGGGANTNWSTRANWDGSVVPVFPIGLTFAGSARVVNSNDLAGLSVNGITFDAAAGPFVMEGNGVTLNGKVCSPCSFATQNFNGRNVSRSCCSRARAALRSDPLIMSGQLLRQSLLVNSG